VPTGQELIVPNQFDKLTSPRQQKAGHLLNGKQKRLAEVATANHLIHCPDDTPEQIESYVSDQQRQALLLQYPDFRDRLTRIYSLLLTIAEREGPSPEKVPGCRDKEGGHP
jgi:hypothetical protein